MPIHHGLGSPNPCGSDEVCWSVTMENWKNEVEKRLGQSAGQPGADQAVIQALAQHLQDRYAELLSSGMEESAARAAVLAELENLGHLRTELPLSKRDLARQNPDARMVTPSSGHFLADFVRDLRYGWRVIRKSPLFALFAVLCLGVGIGANTTV